MNLWEQYKAEKARGNTLRPWYQIVILLPLWPIYWLCKKIASTYENAL